MFVKSVPQISRFFFNFVRVGHVRRDVARYEFRFFFGALAVPRTRSRFPETQLCFTIVSRITIETCTHLFFNAVDRFVLTTSLHGTSQHTTFKWSPTQHPRRSRGAAAQRTVVWDVNVRRVYWGVVSKDNARTFIKTIIGQNIIFSSRQSTKNSFFHFIGCRGPFKQHKFVQDSCERGSTQHTPCKSDVDCRARFPRVT